MTDEPSSPSATARRLARGTSYSSPAYPYSRVDGAAAARPLFQGEDGGSIPTSALHLRINPIGLDTARQLIALWHSALPDFPPTTGGLPYHDCYVAEHDDHWYAAAIWTGPVNRNLNDGRRYELRRFAIAPCAPRYTASRMLAVMARDIRRRRPDVNELISYQLLDTHQGTIYRAAGWEVRHFSKGHEWTGVMRSRPPSQNVGDKQCWRKRFGIAEPAAASEVEELEP